MKFSPQDPHYVQRIEQSFGQQAIMRTLGAELRTVAPGTCQIVLPFQQALTQQDGFLHAGVVTSIVDSACGYAAFTLMPADSRVLTVEFKVNFLSPAQGERFIATGTVLKAGKTITVCEGHVVAQQGSEEQRIAAMQATMICVLSG